MMESGYHPAITAGLMGVATWGSPTLALAYPWEGLAVSANRSLVLQFVVGCALGAVVAGGISLAYTHISRWYAERKAVESPDWLQWESSSLNLALAAREQEDDPTGDLGRFRTGQITIETAPVRAGAPRHARHSAPTASTQTARPSGAAPRHFASSAASVPATAPAASLKSVRPAGRHFAGAVQAHRQPSTVVAEARPRQPKVPSAYVEPSVRPAAESIAAALPTIAPASSQTATPTRETIPVMQSSLELLRKTTPVYGGPQQFTLPERHGLTGRLREVIETRRKGVREVLAERLASDALEGVPHITRADGSSMELKPTWFDQTLVPAIANITGVSNRLDDTEPRGTVLAAEQKKVVDADLGIESSSRSSYIASHVAEVNLGMFPERRTADELEHKDDFEQALAAMGENIGQQGPAYAFQDMVGGPSTIDDPEGLEEATGFIPFRVPAAHPEVVDTETYVDYLLRDELSGNSSQALRRSSRAYLRVIEGGTNPIRMRNRPPEGSPTGKGRHFASSRMAAEA